MLRTKRPLTTLFLTFFIAAPVVGTFAEEKPSHHLRNKEADKNDEANSPKEKKRNKHSTRSSDKKTSSRSAEGSRSSRAERSGRKSLSDEAVTARSKKEGSGRQTVDSKESNSKDSKKVARGQKLDLNTASKEELESLPGVGSETAAAIISARPFGKVSDLKNVHGFGAQKFEQIKSSVKVSRGSRNTTKIAPLGSATQTENPKEAGSKPEDRFSEKKSANSVESDEQSRATRNRMLGDLKPGEVINLNTASQEDIERLPGIGKVKAQAIIEARPFASSADLLKIKGIKEGTLKKLKTTSY